MPQSLRVLAADIAREAGEYALAERRRGVRVADLKSTPTDVVTAADRATEELIRERIRAARPEDGILGEEGASVSGSSGLTWVVDPIDGTVNYLYGIPMWGVSVAVVEGDPDPARWEAVAGAVSLPVLGELFSAARGEGATLNGEPISCSTKDDLGQALVATGFAYAAERRTKQAAVVAGLIGDVRDIRRMGAASVDLAYVACGRLEAYFEAGLHPWDHAAGALVCREAGAVVGGPAGGRESADLVLAAAPALFQALSDRLAGQDV
ncbi:inositol monophosphatase family protein [Mariniluteicoccus endophyticus]